MKKYLPVLLTILLLLPMNTLGAENESIFINFEEGKGNMIASGAQIVADEVNNNSYLMLTSEGEEAYVHKSFRNMKGSMIAGFKIDISNAASVTRYFFVTDNAKMVNVLSFSGGSIMSGDTVLCNYKENEDTNVLMFVDSKSREVVFDINGKKSKAFLFDTLKDGISGFAVKSISDTKAEVILDNMYCYMGTKVLSEYEMMSDEQKTLLRTADMAAYSEYGIGAILDGKRITDTSGAVRVDGVVYLPLRNTVEATGGIVEWKDGITTITRNGTSYTLMPDSTSIGTDSGSKDINAPARLINSSMYLPKNVYSDVIGLNIHTDVGGVYIVANEDSFIKSNTEKELYQILVKTLTGDDYILTDNRRYSIIPKEFASFYMQAVPAVSVTASSEPQAASDGFVAGNVLDGDLSTRWSSDENGAELILDLGAVQDVDGAALAFMNGTVRRAYIEIYTSQDGQSWDLVIARRETSGKTDSREIYPFKASARYVKYKGYGTTAGVWNSVTEFCVVKEG